MQERFEAAESEPGEDLAICMEKFLFQAILDGNGENHVSIVDVEDNTICVAAVGCDGEAASLIGEEVAIDLVSERENNLTACLSVRLSVRLCKLIVERGCGVYPCKIIPTWLSPKKYSEPEKENACLSIC